MAGSCLVPEELAEFLGRLQEALDRPAPDYWQQSQAAKEQFRERVRLGFSGHERAMSFAAIRGWLEEALQKVERALAGAYDPKLKLPRSYYYYEVEESKTSATPSALDPKRCVQRALPPFLEGIVHALRTEPDLQRARTLYRAVRKSELYDERLRMYRVCASLADQPEEIGRCRIFSPGWLENQSIWLHMEYKYLLELLRCGLNEEFYNELFNVLIPFQPASRYGRSVLENCSFLVSSVYHDPALHGAGFVARLSGATAEFLQMWLWMTTGRRPFALDRDGHVVLRLAPVLSKEFFRKDGRFECRLLGATPLTYLNPRRLPTFGRRCAKPRAIRLQPKTGKPVLLKSGLIPHPYATMVRGGQIAQVDVTLAP